MNGSTQTNSSSRPSITPVAHDAASDAASANAWWYSAEAHQPAAAEVATTAAEVAKTEKNPAPPATDGCTQFAAQLVLKSSGTHTRANKAIRNEEEAHTAASTASFHCSCRPPRTHQPLTYAWSRSAAHPIHPNYAGIPTSQAHNRESHLPNVFVCIGGCFTSSLK
jgi:hypothetical protein